MNNSERFRPISVGIVTSMRAAIRSPVTASALAVHAGSCAPMAATASSTCACSHHPVHQFRVERNALAQQGEEQCVFAGVVCVEEVQILPGVRADDLGSCTVIGRGAKQSRELTELAPDDAVDQNHLVGVDAGSGGPHPNSLILAVLCTASCAVVADRPMPEATICAGVVRTARM